MCPAGEMWSVVTLSPNTASTRRPRRSGTRSGAVRDIPSKYGGNRTYVDPGSHRYRMPSVEGSAAQRASPRKSSA